MCPVQNTPRDMSVILKGSCPPIQEVLKLGRECGLVYGLLWEAAFADVRGDCGGTTTWSVKGIADCCGIGKTTAIRALKKLLDAGFIQYAGWAWGSGFKKRRWRVTHPDMLEAQRYAISVMGLPSLTYNAINDKAQSHENQVGSDYEGEDPGLGEPDDCGHPEGPEHGEPVLEGDTSGQTPVGCVEGGDACCTPGGGQRGQEGR